MSGITKILDAIFQNNGGTTKQWRTANEILLTQSSETKKYVSYMKNKIRDLNKDVQLLALDFLDYSIDDGKMPLWTQVGSKDFLQSLVNIYKTRNDEEVQEKILYLIKKWANKFQKYNTIIPNFTNIYNHLKDSDVSFPRDVESTYEKYLQGPGVESGFGDQSQTQKSSTQKTKSKNKNYVRDIDIDLRASSYEKKYKRLVNKLDDWTQQIQDANVYIDSAQDGNFDDDLRGICNDLASGKKQLVDTIESGKLKDEKLMEISLNVQDDIELTLRRWNDLKNGRSPEPFNSSFFNKRDSSNNNNNRRQVDDTNDTNNNNQNKGGFDLLGFDDDFGGNNNNNNNQNTGNDLLNVFSDQNQNSNQGNNFFGNNPQNNNNNNFFGNNNQNNNNDLFGNNNQNNNNQNNNNNFFGNNNNQNNQNQNNNNDLFSQMFNNNQNNANNNNMNNNFMNMNKINNKTQNKNRNKSSYNITKRIYYNDNPIHYNYNYDRASIPIKKILKKFD